jgi:hypothetical protein
MFSITFRSSNITVIAAGMSHFRTAGSGFRAEVGKGEEKTATAVSRFGTPK